MIFLLSMLAPILSFAADPGYCAAIRGNGENVAAHWSALSRFAEMNGLPKKMAGGSSATITMFLLDSMAGNPLVKNEKDLDKKKAKEALLVKSMGEYITQLATNDEALSAQAFMKELNDPNSGLVKRLKMLMQIPGKISQTEVRKAFGKYISLINPEILVGLTSKPLYYKRQVDEAIAVFGKFDAVNDNNLFLRPGLVDFKEVAVTLGTMADFYQGNVDDETKAAFAAYVEDCTESSKGKDWPSLPADGCKKRFQGIVSEYMRKGNYQHKALFEPIGSNIESIPTTALVKGQSMEKYKDLRTAYLNGEKRRDYKAYKADFNDISFGYWTKDGEKIKQALPDDAKSEKFEAMKPGNWFEVLAVSPAEPGLAAMQEVPENTTREMVLAEREKSYTERWKGLPTRKGVLSAGGWSDLHPTGVLKASGCERVGYFSRKGGETKFGQQVFLRLTGENEKVPFWDRVGEQNDTGWDVKGTQAEETHWNQLYNSGNPESSFQVALRLSDFTYCTDWDKFNPLVGEKAAMEKNAYEAPVFVRPGIPQRYRVNSPSGPADPKLYPGCLPLVEKVSEKSGGEGDGVIEAR